MISVDLFLGAHIDAARGIVQQHDARIGFEPLGDDDLLLVATREIPDGRAR